MSDLKSRGFNVKKASIQTNFSEQLWAVIKLVNKCSLSVCNIPIMITCGSEETAKHTAKNTLHYAKNTMSGLGEAVDLRTWHYTTEQRKQIEAAIIEDYPDFRRNFDLIYETRKNKKGEIVSEHWHLEYQPK